MAEKLVGSAELLLDQEESELFARQAQAQRSADVSKQEADYQNEPHGDEQCSKCKMFVPGLSVDIGGYCTKVRSFRGPLGIIFEDGWCKYFAPAGKDGE